MAGFAFMKELHDDTRIDRFVSKYFPLTHSGYAPDDLALLTGASLDTAGRTVYLRKEAKEALLLLAKDFEKKFQRPLVVVS